MATKTLKKKSILDPAIVRIFIVLILIASAVYAYRHYNFEECPSVNFSIAENDLFVGELVEFYCKSENLKSIKWNFGDGAIDKSSISPAHIYKKPGEYIVKLTINGNCHTTKKLLIKPVYVEKQKSVIPKFTCPSKVYVGDRVQFRCLNNDAYSYEWNFGDSRSVDSKRKNPTYKYRKTGKKTITLTVNGEKKYIASKEIFVMPRPARQQAPEKVTAPPKVIPAPQPKPVVVKEEPKIQVISNDEFQKMLKSYAKGQIDAADFNPYLYSAPTKVIVEINSEIMRFSDFLKHIQGQDLNFKEFVTYRDNDKRISRIKIKFKRFK